MSSLETRLWPARDRLIFALDVPHRDQALALVDELASYVGCFKVGLELFVTEGPELVREVVARAPVFLDLKLHDIPATVAGAARAAARLGARYLTVHADLGGRGLAAAVEAAPNTRILAITVLTSVGAEDLSASGFPSSIQDLVLQRAGRAAEVGCAGLVCSGAEAAAVRAAQPALEIITPGVRPAGAAVGDQVRVVTPAAAIGASASALVIGRPLRDAADRPAAALVILEQIAAALES